eukprot:GEMP01037323.1.p1 GENE.GEMP01037323.1~~GEMP01037323.1.p1  ORF type:complete len:209 (+),score=43.41 GEMP01037323.1:229-855(+)
MNRIFGAKKKPEPEYKGPGLEETSAKMDDRTKAIDEKINQCDVEIKAYMAQMKGGRSVSTMAKSRAMQALKRKKMYEAQREQILGQQFNIDQMAFQTENIKATIDTVGAMKQANTAMKGQMKDLNLDQVEDLQDDMAELFDDMQEINDLMSRNYACPEIDDFELEQEFAGMESELAMDAEMAMLGGEIPAYVPPQQTPAAETNKVQEA